MQKVDIYTNTDRAGTLTKEAKKQVFTYQDDASAVISVTMPLRAESWVSDGWDMGPNTSVFLCKTCL